MEKIIIVAACDDKYSSHAGALAASVFANNQDVDHSAKMIPPVALK